MSRASLQTRLSLGALAWILLALAVTGLVLSLLFRQHLENELARRLDADLLQLISQLEVRPDGTVVHVRTMSDSLYQRVYSGHYWQVDAMPENTGAPPEGEPPLRSRSLWDDALTVAGDDGGPRWMQGPRGAPLLAITRSITLPGHAAPLRLTVASTLVPLEAAVAAFRRVMAIALGVLALGLMAAVALQVRLGLRPLRLLRIDLRRIRGQPRARLSDAYPGEVAPLVTDLNRVLADNEIFVERARQQAGNLAHALKTPLSVIGNEADRLTRQGAGESARRLQQEVRAMQRQIEWHLARARIAGTRRAGTATPVVPVVERLQRTLQRLNADRGLVIDVEHAPGAPAFAGEMRDLEQMLGNLMDNACKWARGVVAVRIAADGGWLSIVVDDDGPGLTASQRRKAVTRGRRFDESALGWGLGLAIVKDLVEIYEGRFTLEKATLGGLSARLALPGTADIQTA